MCHCRGRTPSHCVVAHRPSRVSLMRASRVAQTAHGWAIEVKMGGLNAPTQDVFGASGSAKNDTTTAWVAASPHDKAKFWRLKTTRVSNGPNQDTCAPKFRQP